MFIFLQLFFATAFACGGFFCNNQAPVIQEGENILFSMRDKQISATIQIAFSGEAEDFSWVVPLPSEPSSLGVSSDVLFAALHEATDPTFRVQVQHPEDCKFKPEPCLFRSALPESNVGESATVGVDVLQKGEIGPFEFIVIAAKDSDVDGEALFDWLNENDFDQPEAALPIIKRYVGLRHVFLTLKLQKGKAAGELVPIVINYASPSEFDMSCIPLRLTAIAAGDQMPVFAWIAGDDKAAIPHNYLHLKPDLDALPWHECIENQSVGGPSPAFSAFGAPGMCSQQYKELLSNTAKENNVFKWLTTEYLGEMPESLLARIRTVVDNTNFVVADAADQSTREEFVTYVLNNIPAEFRTSEILLQIFEEFAPDEGDVDAVNGAKQIDERLFVPLREALERLESFSMLTRLYTAIDAKDMNRDPIFRFVTDAEPVSNAHSATFTYECPIAADAEFTTSFDLPSGAKNVIEGVKFGDCGAFTFPAPAAAIDNIGNSVIELLSVGDDGEMKRRVLTAADIVIEDEKFTDDIVGILPECNAGSANCKCLSDKCMSGLVCDAGDKCIVDNTSSAAFNSISSMLIHVIVCFYWFL